MAPPGLFGPPLGALIASTIGWRFAFLIPFPVLIACLVLILPSLGEVPAGEPGPIPIARPLVLLLGAAAFFGALTDPSPLTAPLMLGGLAVAVLALRGLVPAGTFRAARGPAAAAGAAFLLWSAFVSAENFIPLMFTDVRMRDLAEVALVLAVTPFTWAAGSWWQSRAVERRPIASLIQGRHHPARARLRRHGARADPPRCRSRSLHRLGRRRRRHGDRVPDDPAGRDVLDDVGQRSEDLSPTLLMDMVGVAVGAGLGGASVAIADHAGAGLTAGLVGAFAVSIAAAAMLLVVAPRVTAARPAASL